MDTIVYRLLSLTAACPRFSRGSSGLSSISCAATMNQRLLTWRQCRLSLTQARLKETRVVSSTASTNPLMAGASLTKEHYK